MLTRILSGLVMAAIMIMAVFKLPEILFNLFALLLMMGALYEWRKLCAANNVSLYLAAGGMIVLYVVYSAGLINDIGLFLLLTAGILLWLIKAINLAAPPTTRKGVCMLDGFASLGLAWLSMVAIRAHFGEHALMLVLLIIWSADSFALFGGKLFGRTRLAPRISPGKTREGVISGALVAMLVALLYNHFALNPLNSLTEMLMLLFVSLLVALISVVGDLSQSKHKRAVGLKDSGDLIPGHGGILDRIDGFMAGIVVYAFYLVMARTILGFTL